ncbi:FMN-dependent NADH-azoreductase [Massilia sp. HP4]|uniref:FMN-dependent NADH-azoreductase n=1 Tax=Massilia sp. HP4 TaxID=2562316 RepID=UPI0010C0C069|nr:NAD(P)H-dependent oxidoreductase [Massilia sp. HP4]
MNILHIDCSPRIESHSRALSGAMVQELLARHPHATVLRRDLGLEPIAHPDGAYAAALATPGAMAAGIANGDVQLSEWLIQEVEAADVLVIGTPMNNFTLPSVFKAWIDQLLRVGRSIGVSASGEKVGLLKDKPVYIGIASGGVFSGNQARQPDFLTPYLTAAFGCIGLKSLQFLPLQATAFLDPAQLEANRETMLATMDLAKVAELARAA